MLTRLVRSAVILFAASAACSACAPGNTVALMPPPVPQTGKGMVYVYWPAALIDIDILPDALKERWTVLIDDKPAGSLTRGEYVAVEVEPGRHAVYHEAPFDLGIGRGIGNLLNFHGLPAHSAPGSAHYFQMHWNGQYMDFYERPPGEGRAAIGTLKLHAQADGLSGGQRVMTALRPSD